MNIKKTILILTVVALYLVTSCSNPNKSISKSVSKTIIDSYVQAVQEDDNKMIAELFPKIIYFERYPKIDSIKIKEYDQINKNILAKGTLYFTNGFGKKFNRKIQLLINPKDSIIVDVLGFLSRKKRNEIAEYKIFETFPDLKPINSDYDAQYLEKKQLAFNRVNGFEYYAAKAIGERTELTIEVSSSPKYSYGTIIGYYNTKIRVDIKNNSDFTVNYEYVDNNYDYKYTFPNFESKEQEYNYETKGNWTIKPNESISQSVKIKGIHTLKHEKSKISIKPKINIENAILIVKKYYDGKTIASIMSGKKDYWNDYYKYRIVAQ
jgi:hypothetical protein